MIDGRDVELVADIVYAEFEKAIRAQSEAMGLNESQIQGRDRLFEILSEFKEKIVGVLQALEIERLEKMSEDMTEVKE